MKKFKFLLAFLIGSFLLTGCEHTRNVTSQSSPSSFTETETSSSEISSLEISSTTTTSSSSEETSSSVYFEDPYVNVNEEEFYANYTEATSYLDSYYRSKHYLMSGSIEDQPQMMTRDNNAPKENGVYIKNSNSYLNEDKTVYTLVDSNGNKVKDIYKGGGYVTLNDVACYLYAFGDIPANYVENKRANPSSNPWGKYLRLNNSFFSDDTEKYPDEPDLPEAFNYNNKKTGRYMYYEIDIGTTGTYEYANGYTPAVYNDGSSITRGGSRIVYTRLYASSEELIETPSERHIFYTYNHYYDFVEFLNYDNGYSDAFGYYSNKTYDDIKPVERSF